MVEGLNDVDKRFLIDIMSKIKFTEVQANNKRFAANSSKVNGYASL